MCQSKRLYRLVFLLVFQVAQKLLELATPVDIYDSLLYGIESDNGEISDTILKHDRWQAVKEDCQGITILNCPNQISLKASENKNAILVFAF